MPKAEGKPVSQPPRRRAASDFRLGLSALPPVTLAIDESVPSRLVAVPLPPQVLAPSSQHSYCRPEGTGSTKCPCALQIDDR